MKKIMLFLAAVVMLVSLSGVVIGADAKAVDKSGAKSASKAEVKPKSRKGGSSEARGREMMAEKQVERMEAEIKRATNDHKEFAATLKEIKKIADKEGAKQTSAKIQELIDKDKKKLDKRKSDIKRISEDFKRRMNKASGGNQRIRPVGAKRLGDGENKQDKGAGVRVPGARKAAKDDADKE